MPDVWNRMALVIFLWFVTVCGHPVIPALDYSGRLDSAVTALMTRYEAVGLSVAVVKSNRIFYHHSWGVRDKEKMIPLQDDDVFRLFSISKSFISTAIMQLVEQKRLALDDDIRRYLPWVNRNPRFPDIPITIEMLLCHRSSINDSQGYLSDFDMLRPERNMSYGQCYNQERPGSAYYYSNVNYNLLGAVIEKVTQMRFDEYIIANILHPLGLHGFYDMSQMGKRHFAQAYQYSTPKQGYQRNASAYAPLSKELSSYVLGETTPLLSPCGGLKLNAAELAEYMMMHMNKGKLRGHRIVKKKSERQMWKVRSTESNYGLALIHYYDIIDGEELIGHRGAGYGINTSMFFNPKKKYGFVILCNGVNTSLIDHYPFHRTLVRILYENII